MNTRVLQDGSVVNSLERPIDLIIHTKAPEKWKLIDLETGEEYLGSEINSGFAEILREKVALLEEKVKLLEAQNTLLKE
jgi:hypothetical protein